jgi:hypothetical protein
MSCVLRMAVKLDGAINHITIVVASCGRCVVFGCRGWVSPWPCGVMVLFLQWIFQLWPKRNRKKDCDIVGYIGGLNESTNTPAEK